ncbi:MAG: helix-turn-helix domain-containing protein [Oscillospiraceae bacterium]|nr:helix-turn-helix domain-containing protein [Oscillospiraceae bacterium]
MLKIGEKIKELRKKLNVTQEKFAEYLDVTAQAVSRWESGICYPDVELFPAIANYFNISLDELFEADKKEEKIKKIKDEIYKKDVHGYPLEAIELCRNALKEFPNNYDIMSTLIGLLKNDAKKNKDEIIELCERILNDCDDNQTKIRTLRDLTMFYNAINDYDKAKSTAEKLPDISGGIGMSQELWLARVLQGEEKLFQMRNVIYWLMEYLGSEINHLVVRNRDFCGGDYKSGAKERIDMLERALKLYELIFSDGDYGFYNLRFKENYSDITEEYLYLEDYDKALDCLEKSADYLIAFENDEGEYPYTSFLIRGYTNVAGFWHSSPETMSYQFINEYLLKKEIFAPIREHARFKAVVEKLQPYAKTVQYQK